jgi:hypothetical protein
MQTPNNYLYGLPNPKRQKTGEHNQEKNEGFEGS